MTRKTSKTKRKTKATAPKELERIIELLANGPRQLAQKAYDALPDVDQLKVMESAKAFLLAALDEYERNVVEPTRKRLKSLGSSKKHR